MRFVEAIAIDEPSGFFEGINQVGPAPSFLTSHSTFLPAWAQSPRRILASDISDLDCSKEETKKWLYYLRPPKQTCDHQSLLRVEPYLKEARDVVDQAQRNDSKFPQIYSCRMEEDQD